MTDKDFLISTRETVFHFLADNTNICLALQFLFEREGLGVRGLARRSRDSHRDVLRQADAGTEEVANDPEHDNRAL